MNEEFYEELNKNSVILNGSLLKNKDPSGLQKHPLNKITRFNCVLLFKTYTFIKR